MALLLSACAHLPPMQPAATERRLPIETECRSLFPQGRWQLVHTIHASLQGGQRATFTGVVVLSTKRRSIHCVLLTLEGMVIFEAVDDGQMTVRRAFGPFDNAHLAKGVMEDIRFLFLEPEGGVLATGSFNDGAPGCRYRADQDRIVDLVQSAEGGWRMHQYDRGGNVLRNVTADATGSGVVSPRMVLDAGGRHGYRLSMILVDAIKLP